MRVLLISCLLIGSVICGPVDKEYGDNSAGTSFVRPPFSPGNLVSGTGVSSGSGSTLSSLIKPTSGNTGLPAPQDVTYSAGSGGYPGVWAPGGSYASGYDSSASVGYGSHGTSSGGSYDGSATAGYGYGGVAPGGSYASGYDSSATAGYGYGGSASGGSYTGGSYTGGSATAGYGYDGSASGGSYTGGYGSSAGGYVGGAGNYGYDAGDDLEPVFSDVSDLDPVYAFSSRSSYQRGRAIFGQSRYTPGEPVPQPVSVRRVISRPSKQSSPKAPTKGAF